jgi:hypothetical protein
MKQFVAIILLSCSMISFAENTELERRLTLSSGYVETYFNSNEGLVHFPLSVMQGYSKLFDVVADNFKDHWGQRLAVALLELPVSYWLAHSLFIPFHEFGHARAMAATGGNYRYGTVLYGRRINNISNFWSLSALRLITPPFGVPGSGIAFTAGRIRVPDADIDSSQAYVGMEATNVTMSGAGLNNQMLLAKKIATTIYERNGHITGLAHYIANKISGFMYANLDQDNNPNNDPLVNGSSDPGSILRSYGKLGYNVTHRDLKILSLASLVSGTTAAFFRGYYDYVRHNDPVVRPLEFFGLRVPDINGYINAQGLSFEIDTDYRITPYLTAGLAYEFIWKGQFTQNFTPKARYNLAQALPVLNEFWLNADVVIGKSGAGGSFGADYAPFKLDDDSFWSRLAYSANLHVYNAKTLYGERNILSVVGGKTVATEVVAAVHMRY